MEIMDVAALDQADSSGDEAVESELEEEILFKSFFDDTEFSKLPDMLEHCKRKFCFDLVKTRDDLGRRMPTSRSSIWKSANKTNKKNWMIMD